MSNSFVAFDRLLATEGGVDYWTDEGITLASRCMSRFEQGDWEMLRASVSERDRRWTLRCAEALGDEASDESVHVLIALLGNPHAEVQLAALDSLASLPQRRTDPARRRREIRAALDVIEKQLPAAGWIAVNLRRRIESSLAQVDRSADARTP